MSHVNESKLKELAKDYIKRCGLDVCSPDMNRSAELAYQSGYVDAEAALQSELSAEREAASKLFKALEMAKEMNDHIFERGKVYWGNTFVKWGIINNSIMAVDQALSEYKKARGESC